jgi:hypothetical protein
VNLTGADPIRHVIVKFSPPTNRAAGRRWADLLVAEHIAGRVLAENGYDVAQSGLLGAGGRLFLEVERFDRTHGGRIPALSLRCLAASLLDCVGEPWPVAASRLLSRGLLAQPQSDQLASIWQFGKLIGNTDMHDGNASLIFPPVKPVRLAPVYDMLPMAYRPDAYGRIPGTSADLLAACAAAPPGRARDMAADFWTRLAESALASAGFRAIARHHANVLSP